MSLADLRALEQAATAAPWVDRRDGSIYKPNQRLDMTGFEFDGMVLADAALVVAARNALPGLLDRVAAAEAERDALLRALEGGRDWGETVAIRAWCSMALRALAAPVPAAPTPTKETP